MLQTRYLPKKASSQPDPDIDLPQIITSGNSDHGEEAAMAVRALGSVALSKSHALKNLSFSSLLFTPLFSHFVLHRTRYLSLSISCVLTNETES